MSVCMLQRIWRTAKPFWFSLSALRTSAPRGLKAVAAGIENILMAESFFSVNNHLFFKYSSSQLYVCKRFKNSKTSMTIICCKKLTCVRVIFVIMASIIFSPLVGYGFFLCSFSHAFRVAVDSRVAFLRRAARS